MPENNSKLEETLRPIESYSVKDFTIQFLKDTKDWDGVGITKEYHVAARSATEVMTFITNMRVSISRIRATYRAAQRKVPAFRFTSRVVKLADQNQNGYESYAMILGKQNSASSVNRNLIEELA